jgi:hypothetical protein
MPGPLVSLTKFENELGRLSSPGIPIPSVHHHKAATDLDCRSLHSKVYSSYVRMYAAGDWIGVVECIDDRDIELVQSQRAGRLFEREAFGLAYHQYKPQ